MKLKFFYSKEADIPEGMKDLYTERDGKWELTGIEGIKSQADLDNVQGALNNERDAHKKSKTDLQKEIDRLKEENAKFKKPEDDDEDDKPADKGGKSKDPSYKKLEKKMEDQQKDLDDLKKERDSLAAEKQKNTILKAIRDKADGKVKSSAISDVEMHAGSFEITEDGDILTKDGQNVEDWLTETLKVKEHWVPESISGGAKGSESHATPESKQARLDEILKLKKAPTLQEQSEGHTLAKELEVKDKE